MATFFVVFCGVLGVAFVAVAIGMGLKAGRTRSWVLAEGRVLSTGITILLVQGEADAGDIESFDRTYQPYVTYAYVVDGIDHVGRLIAPDTAATVGSDTWALRTVARYPVASVVAVHHDPGKPARAVLEPGASRTTVVTIGFLVVLAALCMTIAVLIANDPPPIPPADFRTPN